MIVLALAVGLTYGAGVRSLARRGRSWPVPRSLAAAASAAAIAASGFAPEASLTGHMVEHILLGMVAPLLLALSAPVTLALQTTPPFLRPKLRRALHSRTLTVLSHPVIGLVIFGTTLIVLYLSPLLALSARNDAAHVAVHLHLLAVGALFMWPLVGVDPIPGRVPFAARVLTIMAAVPFHAFLGLALVSSTTVLAPSAYPSLDDQHRAGGLLWMSGELMSFVLASIAVRAWLTADNRAARRADARDARDARDDRPVDAEHRTDRLITRGPVP